ncbi:MAG: SpoIIE family protein phosphatase [Clostridiales bacterium]|nr:SpoIIE family protein phosphatase [Clostridiales bacterium]
MEGSIKRIAEGAAVTPVKAGAKAKPRERAFSLSLLIFDSALALISLLLASFAPFEGISPFGMACVLACWYSGADPYFGALGAAVGYAVTGAFGYAVSAALLGVFIWFVNEKGGLHKLYRLLAGFFAEALFLSAAAVFQRGSFPLYIGSATVSVLGAVVMGCGLHALRTFVSGRELTDTELLTLAATLGLITLSMRSFRLFGQSPAMIFAGACALFAAYRLGPASVALSVTVAAGRALAMGGDLHFVSVLAGMTLVAASVRVFGKWTSLAAFCGVGALIRALIGGVGVLGFAELALAGGIFAAVPTRLYCGAEGVLQSRPSNTKYGRLQLRAASLCEVLSELARVYGGEVGRLLFAVSGTLRRALSGIEPVGRTKYRLEYGSAKSAKYQGGDSGDSLSVLSFGSAALLALSDGMGSGSDAANESRSALALLTDLISVGFELGEAAKCVNDLMSRRANTDMYATLDALMIDLRDGTAKLCKNGAPKSFVLRGGKVCPLYTEALPIGIIESAGGGTKRIALKPGDTVIMMTDGVSDALGSGLVKAITQNVLGYGDPDISAHALLEEAQKRGSRDDMTVLLARIEEKEKKSA